MQFKWGHGIYWRRHISTRNNTTQCNGMTSSGGGAVVQEGKSGHTPKWHWEREAQYSTIQHNRAQYRAIQHSTAQKRAIQRCTLGQLLVTGRSCGTRLRRSRAVTSELSGTSPRDFDLSDIRPLRGGEQSKNQSFCIWFQGRGRIGAGKR